MKRWCGIGSVVAVAAVLVATLSVPAVSAQPQIADDVSPVVVSTGSTLTVPAAKNRTVSLLYAATAQRGSLTKVNGKKRTYVMTLRGTSEHVTWFTDRPARQSGFLPTAGFVSSWAGYGFAEDPPNVALVVRDQSGATDTVVAVMRRPTVNAKGVFTARLRVLSVDQAQQVGGSLAVHADRHDMKVPTRFTSVALFIDNVNGTYVGTSPTGCLIQAFTTCPNANLSGADLSGASLPGADLSGADLSGANLGLAYLAGADLSGANLSGANLSGAVLSGAVLSGADLSGADLSGADLFGVDLSGADLFGANLSGADLRSTDLSGADLSGAVMSGALLYGSLTDATTTCPAGNAGPCW